MNKNIGVIVTISLFLIGIFVMWGKIQAQNEMNLTKTEKLEEKVEETEEEVNENEKVDIKQTVLIEQIAKTLEKLNNKIDKE